MHDEHTEVDLDAYLRDGQKRADSGEYWYLWILLPLLSGLVFWLFWGWRGVGFVVIWGIVILVLLVARSALLSLLAIGAGVLVTFIYFMLAFQTT